MHRSLILIVCAAIAVGCSALDESTRRDLESLVDGVIQLHNKVQVIEDVLRAFKIKLDSMEQENQQLESAWKKSSAICRKDAAPCPEFYRQVEALEDKLRRLESQEKSKDANKWLLRNCEEIRIFQPAKPSGMYKIDPDGPLVGEEPISVYCNMTTGSTSVSHDAEDFTEIDNCMGRGCFQRPVAYYASMRQMIALIRQSKKCHQTFELRFDCSDKQNSWLESSWWQDRNNVTRRFFTCAHQQTSHSHCSVSSCLDHNKSDLLPVTRLNLGRRTNSFDPTEADNFFIKSSFSLGKLECSGIVQGPPGPPGPKGDIGRNAKTCPKDIGSSSSCTRIPHFGCYCIVQSLKNWNASARFCRSRGMDLVSLESAEEWAQLADLLRKKKSKPMTGTSYRTAYSNRRLGYYGTHFWTAGTFDETQQEWVWSSSGEPLNFTNWQHGQPDSKDVNEQVVIIRGEDPFNWNDVSRINQRNSRPLDAFFICES